MIKTLDLDVFECRRQRQFARASQRPVKLLLRPSMRYRTEQRGPRFLCKSYSSLVLTPPGKVFNSAQTLHVKRTKFQAVYDLATARPEFLWLYGSD
jgi:hypothetical protein